MLWLGGQAQVERAAPVVVEEDVVNGGFDFCFRGGCLSCGFIYFI